MSSHVLHPGTWTLRSKLVAALVALFTVILLATGTATVFLTRAYLVQQVDDSLRTAASGPRPRTLPTFPADDDHVDPGDRTAPVGGIGDVLHVEVASTGEIEENRVTTLGGTSTSLTSSELATLLQSADRSAPTSVALGSTLGTYRVVASTGQDGRLRVTGVPLHGVDEMVTKTLLLVTGTTLAGLVLVSVGGTYIVRRNLAPLSRVAATARQMGELHLDSGEVTLPARVPEADATPHTEVGQVGHALNSLLDNVEGALQARQQSEMRVRQFVADASHELRTPLASIRGYAELSRREKDPVPAGVTHALGRVEAESLRMQGLVEDLLLLARLDSGRPLDRGEVDLSMLAMNLVSDAHAAAPDHRWELELPDEPVEVAGDEARLHQVFANLLANARTHTPAGTTVTMRVRPHGEDVEVTVADNGPGIPENLQPHVFERFTRADDARNRSNGSTGLGLSIVAAVTKAHRGRVSLTSRPGETAFTVLLPSA